MVLDRLVQRQWRGSGNAVAAGAGRSQQGIAVIAGGRLALALDLVGNRLDHPLGDRLDRDQATGVSAQDPIEGRYGGFETADSGRIGRADPARIGLDVAQFEFIGGGQALLLGPGAGQRPRAPGRQQLGLPGNDFAEALDQLDQLRDPCAGGRGAIAIGKSIIPSPLTSPEYPPFGPGARVRLRRGQLFGAAAQRT